MRQYQVVSVAFSVFALSFLSNRSVSANTFTWQLQNQTSETLTEFYVVPSMFTRFGEPEDLGPNQLTQTVAPNLSTEILLNTNSQSCFYDFIGVFGNRLRIHASRINLCNLDNNTYAFGGSNTFDDLFNFSESELAPWPDANQDENQWPFSSSSEDDDSWFSDDTPDIDNPWFSGDSSEDDERWPSSEPTDINAPWFSDDTPNIDNPWFSGDTPDIDNPWFSAGSSEDSERWPLFNSDGQNLEPGSIRTSNAPADTSTLTLNNKTRHALIDVYITPSSADTFGPDKLPSRLNSGASLPISLDVNSPECSYDLLGVFADGSEVVDYGIDLCRLRGGTYSFLDPENETQDIQIYNGTIKNIVGLRITAEYNETTNGGSRSGSYDQEITSSGDLFRSDEEFLFTTGLEVENCAVFETYELTATFSDSTKETKNIDACSSETIVFGNPKSGAERRFTVQNGFNNAVLWELYATKPADRDWGYDLLKDPVAASERSNRISLIDDVGDCLYDIRAIFIDPQDSSRKLDPIEQYGVNVCDLNNANFIYSPSTLQSNNNVDIESIVLKSIEKQIYSSKPKVGSCPSGAKSNFCRKSPKNTTESKKPWWKWWN